MLKDSKANATEDEGPQQCAATGRSPLAMKFSKNVFSRSSYYSRLRKPYQRKTQTGKSCGQVKIKIKKKYSNKLITLLRVAINIYHTDQLKLKRGNVKSTWTIINN